MVQARVGLEYHPSATVADTCSKVPAVGRVHGVVGEPDCKERGGVTAVHEMDGLGVGPVVLGTERGSGAPVARGEGQKVVGSGEADKARQPGVAESYRLQVAFIEAQQRSDMCA